MKTGSAGPGHGGAWLVALALGAALPGIALPSAAQELQTAQAVIAFEIPAQDLNGALIAFADRAGVQVFYDVALVRGLRSAPLSGRYSAQEALARLLAGTGLAYSFANATTVAISNPAAGGGGSLILSPVTVTGQRGQDAASGAGFLGTPDWVYATPESVSVVTREAIQSVPVRDTRDLMGTVAGVFSGEGNGSFPTVSPNIRGLQDGGRVVVSIDGARQNAQRGLAFGSSGYQSNAGQAFVDAAFVRMVEIDKNPGAKAGDAASLGGSVNFRTLGAEDLIPEGKSWGTEVNALMGSNEYNFQGSVLGAVRLGEMLSVTLGLSTLDLGAYAPGTKGAPEPGSLEAGITRMTERETWSSLLKLEFGNQEGLTAEAIWMHQSSDFGYGVAGSTDPQNLEMVRNDSLVVNFGWNPNSPLLDLKANFWLNSNRMDEHRLPRGTIVPDTYVELDTLSFGLVLENTSLFETGLGGLSLNYGLEAFRDKASSSATSETLKLNPIWEASYTAFSPPGRRDVASAFVNGAWEPADWITLQAGLRYDWYRLKGDVTYYNRTIEYETVVEPTWVLEEVYHPELTLCELFGLPTEDWCDFIAQEAYTSEEWVLRDMEVEKPYRVDHSHTAEIDRSDGAWLPSVTLELRPVSWFRPYLSYSHSFRPPTVLEAFFTGAAPADALPDQFAPNLGLEPERARTWEIGANISADRLITGGDRLRLKLAAFHREVEDFIAVGDILAPGVVDKTYYGFVNLDGTTTMRGLEIEGAYDAGFLWLGAAVSWLETEWPEKTDIFSNGTRTTDGEVFAWPGNVPPKFKLTLDGGLRFFDEQLALGARYSHVTPSLTRRLDPETGEQTEITEEYRTLDLYGSLRLGEHATLRVSVLNVTDSYYIPGGAGYAAPGRTYMASFSVKF